MIHAERVLDRAQIVFRIRFRPGISRQRNQFIFIHPIVNQGRSASPGVCETRATSTKSVTIGRNAA